MMFSVANLGDAALSLPSVTVTGAATLEQSGFCFVNNAAAAPITLTLPDAVTGLLIIKDIAGNAGQYPVTVSASSIDGTTTTLLSVPYQWVALAWNGAGYSIIG